MELSDLVADSAAPPNRLADRDQWQTVSNGGAGGSVAAGSPITDRAGSPRQGVMVTVPAVAVVPPVLPDRSLRLMAKLSDPPLFDR